MDIKETFFDAQMGLLGTGITSDTNRVWITKTHYPLARPDCTPFSANKMVVLARNPIDVIPSMANLMNTQSHSLEINEQYDVDFPEIWWEWVAKISTILKTNHDEVYEDLARNALPTYFMRYEDLKLAPVTVLEELFCFLLDVPSIEGTVVERRIQEVT